MANTSRLPNPWGAETILLESVDSTNNYAKDLARRGAPHGTAVLSDCQTGGKGRRGRSFSSPPGVGIYCSVVLRFDAAPEQLLHLTPMVAEAVRRAVAQSTGLEPEIKWINDLLLEDRKLCGILTELGMNGDRLDFLVVGIGINCNQQTADFPPELRETAVSLAQVLGRPVDRTAVAAQLLTQLHAMSRAVLTGPGPWLDSYRTHCVTLGRDVQLIRGGQRRNAHVDGMDDQGALLVTLPDGSHETVFSGEVSVRGLAGYV